MVNLLLLSSKVNKEEEAGPALTPPGLPILTSTSQQSCQLIALKLSALESAFFSNL
jgi:hypothetical protein